MVELLNIPEPLPDRGGHDTDRGPDGPDGRQRARRRASAIPASTKRSSTTSMRLCCKPCPQFRTTTSTTLGDLMNVNQGLLNALQVSTPELERLIDIARDAGALGAKLTGGGGGGAMIALCKKQRRPTRCSRPSSDRVSAHCPSRPAVHREPASPGDECRRPLILVDEADREVGTLPRPKVTWAPGLLHRAFSVFLFDKQGAVLIQQRARRQDALARLLVQQLLQPSAAGRTRRGRRLGGGSARNCTWSAGSAFSTSFATRRRFGTSARSTNSATSMPVIREARWSPILPKSPTIAGSRPDD